MKLQKIFRILLSVLSLFVGTRCFALEMKQQYPEPACAVGQKTDIKHMIIWGNTLSQAAAHYGVHQSTIQAASHIADADKIYMGNMMVIPCTVPRTTAIASNTRKAVVAPHIAIATSTLLETARHPGLAATERSADTAMLASEPAVELSLASVSETVAMPTADLPTADSATVVAVTPAPLSLPKGWVNITLDIRELPQAIAAGMFPAVFLDNFGADGKWQYRKDTRVNVVMNGNDTVTITTLFPKTLTSTSEITFIARDKNGKEVGRHKLTGDELLARVQLNKVQRLPAPGFAKFNFGDRKIAGADRQMLHLMFEKRPSQVVGHLVSGAVAAGLTAGAVFNPLMWSSAGPQDFNFVRSLVKHNHPVEQSESDDLQPTNQARAPDTTTQQ